MYRYGCHSACSAFSHSVHSISAHVFRPGGTAVPPSQPSTQCEARQPLAQCATAAPKLVNEVLMESTGHAGDRHEDAAAPMTGNEMASQAYQDLERSVIELQQSK